MIVASILFYFSAFLFSDIFKIYSLYREFNWFLFPLVLFLVACGYFIRMIRWKYYLNLSNINISFKKANIIFICGLSMSVTPAKSGELIKSYLLKEQNNISYKVSAPIIFTERLTDLIGMILLSLIGFLSFQDQYQNIFTLILLLAMLLLLLHNQKTCLYIISVMNRFPKLDKLGLKQLYLNSLNLLKLRPFLIGIFLSIFSWFLEGISFFIILSGVNAEISMYSAISIFSLSSLIGIATMLPGGLGSTEGSIIGLLQLENIVISSAVFSTLLIRVCTLWFAVLLGLFALNYNFRNVWEGK